jgi:propanol-preferring alcohol dehydrogenase
MLSSRSCSWRKQLGAAYTVNAALEDPVEAIKALGGADAAIILAAAPKPCEQAFASLRRNGRLVFVGSPAGQLREAADLRDAY